MAIDASAVTYSPEDDTDWLNDVDPGDVDDALDQLAAECVKGPASSTNKAIARWDSTTGKLLQDGPVLLADNGGMTEVRFITGKAGFDFTITPASDEGLDFTLTGGSGSDTGPGGIGKLKGGEGGATSGNAGPASLIGGDANDGNGGDANITATAGVGIDKAGGNVPIVSGRNTGSGVDGKITFDGVDAATLAIGLTQTDIKTSAYTANDRELVRVDPT